MIPEQTGSLPQTNLESHPGMCKVYAIDIEDIVSMPDLKSMLKSIAVDADMVSISDIELKDGGAILSITNENQAGTDIIEDDKASAHNSYFPYSIAFVLQNDDANTRGRLLRAYYQRQYIVIAKQATGAWRIFGSLHRGCDFKGTLDTASQLKGINQYKCSFTWESATRAYYMHDPKFISLRLKSVVYGQPFLPATTYALTFVFDASGFTGTETGDIQIYREGSWQNLTTYSILSNVLTTVNVSGGLPAGTYFLRLRSDTGIVSNTVIVTV